MGRGFKSLHRHHKLKTPVRLVSRAFFRFCYSTVCLIHSVSVSSATSMDKKPNILLILTDQHRLSAVGAYGPTPCQTPHIDRLASEGVRFETVYTTCPVCSPARGSIMTGLYPHTHGICSNVHNLGSSVHEIPDGPTISNAIRTSKST